MNTHEIHAQLLGEAPLLADRIQGTSRSDPLSDGAERSRRVKGGNALLR